MSNTETFKLKAHALQSFFKERKVALKYNHCLEAVSQLETGLPWNTSKKLEVVKTLRIFQLNEKVVLSDIKQENNSIEVVIPIELSTLMFEEVDEISDHIYKYLTDENVTLEDFGYEVYPHFYDSRHVALRVEAKINDYQEETNTETKKYTKKDMVELIHHIKKFDTLMFNDGTYYYVTWCCGALDELLTLTDESELLEDMSYAFDFVRQSSDYSKAYEEESVRYDELFYSTKNQDGSWTLAGDTRSFKFL